MLVNVTSKLKNLICLSVLFSCPILSAQILPLSDETQIHSESVGDQNSVKITTNTLGEQITAYNEKANGLYKTYLKHFDQNGNLIATNVYNNGGSNIQIADIAMNNNGDSVAVFSANSNAYLQIFNRQGNPKFSGFIRLNNIDDLSYGSVAVDINDSGEAIVSWLGYKFGVTNVYLRQLNVDGYWMSNQLIINNPTPYTADVGIDSAGDFLVTWASSANNVRRVYTQHYYSGGTNKRSRRTVFTSTSKVQGYPQVAVNRATGEHVISWTDLSVDNEWYIYARKFNASGSGEGSAFKVSTTPSLWEPTQSIQYNDNIVWISWHTLSGTSDDVFAASFFDNGIVRSAETQLNIYTTGQQREPAIGLLPNNELVVAWKSYLQDGDGWGLYQRRFVD